MTNFIFINGKGSSGKDTQADILKEKIGDKAIKISTGDIYRDAKIGEGEYGKYHAKLAKFTDVDKGNYIPDEVIVDIVKEVIYEKICDGYDTFIFTGFPRTIPQLKLTTDLVNSLEESKSFHIFYEISDDTSRERARTRREIYIAKNLQIRPDDDPVIVENRLRKFNESTFPMIQMLKNEGQLIKINAEGTISEIEKETSIYVIEGNKKTSLKREV